MMYSSTPHLMGRDPGRPVKYVGRLMGRMDVVVAVIYHISWAATRAGPLKYVGRLLGCAERPIGSPHLMDRGPAWLIKFRDDRPPPGPAHLFYFSGDGPRPGPTHLLRSFTARPGLVHQFFENLGAARPGPSYLFSKYSARPGPA